MTLFGAEIPTEKPTIPLVVPTLPHTSPIMCAYSSETSNDSSERPPSQDPYEFTIAWSSCIEVSTRSFFIRPFLIRCLARGVDLLLATIFAGPSHKRCRSPTASVSLATPIPRTFSPVCADLLPPRKRIRGTVTTSDYDDSTEGSYEAYIEPDIDSDVQEDINVDIATAETIVALEVVIEIEADVGVEVDIRIKREDEVEEETESGDRGTIEIGVDRVSDIEIT
ncbi:hypothetical protein Tco_0482192 [Tanacetum coccineum]